MNGFRLSPQQRRIFEIAGDGPVERFRVVGMFTLAGALDLDRLEDALTTLVDRYEILRTGFPEIAGLELPLQVPGEPARFGGTRGGLSRVDWTGESPQGIDERLAKLRRELFEESLDPASGDLLRVRAVRVADDRHLLVVTQAALTADGPSVALLATELMGIYGSAGGPDEPLQYADLAEWMSEILEGDDAPEGTAYWTQTTARGERRALAVENTAVENTAVQNTAVETAAVDSASPAGSGCRDWVRVDLPADTRAALDRFAGQSGSSRRDVLFALWSHLIARHADAEIVTVSTLFDGRSYEGLDEAIGPFARYLPIVVETGDDDRLADRLSRVARRLSEAGEWQEYFSWERVGEPSDALRHAFSFERLVETTESGGIALTGHSTIALAEPHTLELAVSERGGDLEAEIRYDRAAFAPETAARLAAGLRALLDDALARPDSRLVDLSMVDDEERARLLSASRCDAPPPEVAVITEAIGTMAAQRGDAAAIVCGDNRLTYQEAWRRAGALAAELESKGTRAGDVVAVCCERSLEMIVALLGVLRSGAAYLPLDPAHPDDRLEFMVEDAGVRFVVCHQPTADRSAALPAQTVILGTDPGYAAAGDTAAEPSTAAPDPGDIAYIIYTSGSTGLPKAVAVTHSNLLHSTVARSHFYPESPESFLLLSSFAFDSSVVGIFWTLSTGGTLVVPEQGAEQDPGLLAELVERHGITHTLCLPTLYNVLLEQTPPERLASLRQVVVAGEACSPALARRHLELRPEGRLVNEYGPTEASVWAIATELDAASIVPSVPIGRPIPYAAAYLLDPAGRPVPRGVVGEIHLGGEGVTRGYLGRPALTGERFVPDPFSGRSGARLYRTGDRGRIRADGLIEFLGRFDHQVKLRGYRIEPGEIESRLEESPAVRQAVVVARPGESGEDRLIAYLVAADAALPTVSDLRASLQRTLPEYMIPSIFVPLEEMPLTPTGKVDLNALPEPEQQRPDLAAAYEAAATSLEGYLVGRWEEILETEPIGVNDNFFELGGNSIQAAIFMNRIRGEIDDFIHVGRLFENPTVRSLAGYLESEHTEAIGRLDTSRRPEAEAPIRPAAGALDRIESMSDTEVDSMLATLLAEEEGDS